MKGRATIEMMGSPAEYVEKALKKVEEKLRTEYEVLDIKYEKPAKVGEKYYSVFFETEIDFENLEKLMTFVLNYGPSTFEVLETKPISINPLELQNVANDVTMTMHEMLKQVTMLRAQLKMLQRKALEDKVKIMQDMKTKEKTKTTEKTTEKPQTKKKAKK